MLAVLRAMNPGSFPPRTAIALAAIITNGLARAGCAARVLTTPPTAACAHSIAAGRLAVAFTSAFAVAGPIVALANGSNVGCPNSNAPELCRMMNQPRSLSRSYSRLMAGS